MSFRLGPLAPGAVAALPKVSLHEHLDGGLRPATMLDLAARQGYGLPADNAQTLAAWFRAAASSGRLERYLELFEHTVALMQTPENLRRVAREYVEDLVADGVVYAEVRWAPEQHQRAGLSVDAAVEAVQAGLEEAVAAAQREGAPIEVSQILCALRQHERAGEIARLVVRWRERGVVGFDVAGPEAGHPASGLREVCEFLHGEGVPVTVHAGKGAGVESVRSALVQARASRLGHGVRLAEDLTAPGAAGGAFTLGATAAWVRDRQIPLELCPSSNVDTGATALWGPSLAEHPFDALYRAGFCVTVSPDNRLMSGASLTGELERLCRAFGYTFHDLRVFALNAARAAFVPLPRRQRLQEQLTAAYARVPGCPASEVGEAFEELATVVAQVREHCPWTRQLTPEALTPFLAQEAGELAEAVHGGQGVEHLRDEVGDVLLQVLLHAEIGRGRGEYDVAGVARHLSAKLRRRCPHIFDAQGRLRESFPSDPAVARLAWERAKAREVGRGCCPGSFDTHPHL